MIILWGICAFARHRLRLRQIFLRANSRNIHEFADYAKVIYTGQNTCCMYQRGKRVIVKNMATFSDDLVFAISIQFATFRGVQCSCLYNLLCVHTCHLSRNKG